MNSQRFHCKAIGWERVPAPTPETAIDGIALIPVGIPPKMLPALQVPNKPAARYICLTYQSTDCYVEYIYGAHTDSYWVYSAFIDHFAVAIHLVGCDLGSDDTYPTYGLLIDRQQNKIWVAPYSHIQNFLKVWREYSYPEPILTPEERQQITKKFWEQLVQGMKEMPKPSSEEISAIVQAAMQEEGEAIASIREYLNPYLPEAVKIADEKLSQAQQNNEQHLVIQLGYLLHRLTQNSSYKTFRQRS